MKHNEASKNFLDKTKIIWWSKKSWWKFTLNNQITEKLTQKTLRWFTWKWSRNERGTWFEANLPSIWVLRVAQVGPNNTDPQLTDGQPKRNVTSITCRSEGVQVVLWCRGVFFLKWLFTWNLCIYTYIICKIMIWDVLNMATSESDMEFNWPFLLAMSHMFPSCWMSFAQKFQCVTSEVQEGLSSTTRCQQWRAHSRTSVLTSMVYLLFHQGFMRSFYKRVGVQAYAAIIFIIFEHCVCFGRWLLHCWHGWYI